MLGKPLPGLLLLAGALLTGCEQRAAIPTTAVSSDATTLTQTVDLSGHVGQSYEAFSQASDMSQFALENLELTPGEHDRIARALAVSQPSRLISGGGAQALVFVGCARTGCDAGTAVLAFGNRGERFVGVRDGVGESELVPDDRLEVLLRLNSPSQQWDDPTAPQPPTTAAAP